VTTADLLGARTFLFAPGHRSDLVPKAMRTSADVVICDLEDGVPADLREEARHQVDELLGLSPGALAVRMSAVDSADGQADLALLAQHRQSLLGIVIAKCESPEHLRTVRDAVPDVPLLLLIESAHGLDQLDTLTSLGLPNLRLVLGSLDLAVDLDCDPGSETVTWSAARLVVASRRGDLPSPVSGVTPQTDDPVAVHESARLARAMGFTGKLCIHPAQLAPAAEGLAPTAASVAWARSITAAAIRTGGTTAIGGEMVDAPVVARAERILLEVAASVGHPDPDWQSSAPEPPPSSSALPGQE